MTTTNNFCPHCNPCRHQDRIATLETALRNIVHATAPGKDDGYHENAYYIAICALLPLQTDRDAYFLAERAAAGEWA